MEIEQPEGIGHREDADDHGIHLAENRSQNQSLEGRVCVHSFSLPAVPPT